MQKMRTGLYYQNYTLINSEKNLLIFKMNVNNTKLLDKQIWNRTPTFYEEMIKTWINVNNCENNHHDQINNYLEIRKQVIWGNRYKKKSRKMFIL